MMRITKFASSNIVILFISIVICGITLFPAEIDINTGNNIFIYVTICVSFLAFIKLVFQKKIDLIDLIVILFFVSLFLFYCNNSDNTIVFHVKFLFCFYFSLRILISDVSWRIFWILCLSIIGIIESLLGLLQLVGIYESNNSYFNLTGTFFNPGPYGGFLAIVAVVLIVHIVSEYKEQKGVCINEFVFTNKKGVFKKYVNLLSLLSLVFIFIILPFSKSRSAFIAMIIPVVIFFLQRERIKIRSWFLNSCILNIFLVLVFFVVFILFMYFIRPESVNSRFITWYISFMSFKESLLFGNGIGSFLSSYAIAQEEYYKEVGFNSIGAIMADVPDYAFNEYLEIACEIGVIRLLCGIIIIIIILYKQRGDNPFKYGLISFLCFSFTSYPLHILQLQILFLIMLSERDYTSFCIKKMRYIIIIFVYVIIFLFCFKDTGKYIKKIIATKMWQKEILIYKASAINTKNLQNYKSLYLHLNDNPRFLLDYGVLLYNNKSYNESIYVLLQGDSISNNPAYLNVVGKNYESIACYSSAEYYYRKAFSRVPSRLYPLYSMAILYYKLNRYDDFVNLSDSILRFEPKVTSFVTNAMKKEISDILNALRKDGVCENK